MSNSLAPDPATTRARPRRDQVRADLVAAARSAFLTKGYGASSLAAIARAAGYTKGAIYSNFGGKEELFAEVCRSEFDTTTSRLMTELLATTAALSDEAATRLAILITTQSELQAAVGEFRSLAHHSPEAAGAYGALRSDQIELLTAELTRQEFLGADPAPGAHRETAVLLLITINAFALEHRAAPDTFTPALLVNTIARMVRGLLP